MGYIEQFILNMIILVVGLAAMAIMPFIGGAIIVIGFMTTCYLVESRKNKKR